MSGTMGEILTAVVGELISRGFSATLHSLLKRRAEAAREILLEELSRGEIPPMSASNEDEFAAILFRYMRAAQEGAGRRNLILMARAFRGVVQQRPIPISHFAKWANILDDLTHEEIVLAAALHRHIRDAHKADVKAENLVGAAYLSSQQELVPGTFADSEAMGLTASALARTGLVVGVSAWNGLLYRTTSLMDELEEICHLNEA